jgi:membrane-associated phospholipid phosphatase
MLPDAFWACVTVCGDALIAMAVLAPFIRRRPELVFAFLAGGIMTAATVHSIKPRLRVPRPAAIVDAREIRVIGPVLRGRAFPSGHSATAFLAAGIVAMGTARGWVFAAALAAAALVALSRVVVGAHWPADVVAGAAIGWSGAWLGLLVARHWRWGWTYPGALACGGMCLVAFVAIAVVDHTGYGQALAFQRVVGVAATVWGCWEYARLAKIVRPAAGAPAVATETSAPR